jgi:mono/diheme cytochrome c family protein
MTTRRVVGVVACAVLAASVSVSTVRLASASPTASKATRVVVGRTLYRKYCGQCHALAEALSAGFGSNKKGGLGDLGGPSFNDLRVSYSFSVTAVTEPTGGHEAVRKKISPNQLHVVARWIAQATAHNPVPALPTDG